MRFEKALLITVTIATLLISAPLLAEDASSYLQLTETNQSLSDLSIFSEEQARDYFQRFLNDPALPFKVPELGCSARAHYMVKALDQDGLKVAKAFVFGDLTVGSNFSPLCLVRWNYHVAPLIKVRVGQETQLQVLDPAILPRPMPVRFWVLLMTIPERAKVFFTPRFAYGDNDLFTSTQWDPGDDALMRDELAIRLKTQADRLRIAPDGIRCQYPEP